MIEGDMKVLVIPMEVYSDRDYPWLKMFAAKNIEVVFVSYDDDDIETAEDHLKCKFQNTRFNGEIRTDAAVYEICRKLDVVTKNVAYVGYDLFDVPALRTTGIPLCSKDADYFVKRVVSEQHMRHALHMSSTHIQTFDEIPNIMPDKYFPSVLEWIYVQTFGLPKTEDMNKMFLIEKLQNERNVCDF